MQKYWVSNLVNYIADDASRHMTDAEIEADYGDGKELPPCIIVHPNLEKRGGHISLTEVIAPSTTFEMSSNDVSLYNSSANKISVEGSGKGSRLFLFDCNINDLRVNNVENVYLQDVSAMSRMEIHGVENIILNGVPDLQSLYSVNFGNVRKSRIEGAPKLVTSRCDYGFGVEVLPFEAFGKKRLMLKQNDHYVTGKYSGNAVEILEAIESEASQKERKIDKINRKEVAERYAHLKLKTLGSVVKRLMNN